MKNYRVSYDLHSKDGYWIGFGSLIVPLPEGATDEDVERIATRMVKRHSNHEVEIIKIIEVKEQKQL